MAKVTLKINGQEVEVEKGSTILEAAKQLGIYIPTLCYHPYLPLEEACRICVVEEMRGGWSTLVAACVYPVRNGMIIETDSEKVIESRKTIMDLLLSDHPNDCMTCYAAGECELQDMAHLYEIKTTPYEGERHKHPVDPDPNAYLRLDMNKCILCRRCIRACHDIEGADIWTKVGRGFDQRISTAFDLPLVEAGCEECGHCADFCPVDAIGFRVGRGTARSWQYHKSSTVCLQCSSGCRAVYDSLGNKVVRVRGDFNSPASAGALCKMGRFNFDFINSPERLTTACVRKDGQLAESSVDEAIQAAAAGLSKANGGGNAVGIICGGMLTNEEYYLAQKLARGALGTNNVDNIAGPWTLAVYEGLSGTIGLGAMTDPLSDIAKAGSVLVMGSNTLEKHAIAALRARKAAREGAELIVAHPDQVPLTKTARLHLPLKAGSEEALVLGLMKTIVSEGLFDKQFVEGQTQDFDKFARSLDKIKMAELAENTGLAEEKIVEAARLYASKRPACLVYGVDPGSSPANDSFYRACCMLQLLLGSVGVVGGGVNIMGGTGNAQGAADLGAIPKYMPGYRPATAPVSRKGAGKVWGVEPTGKAGKSWQEMIAAIEKGELKALYVIGANLFDLGIPKAQIEGALSRLECLVVQASNKSEMIDFAHVVLPGATFVEKEGTATNCERRIQVMEKAISCPGNAKADFDLINGIMATIKPELKTEGIAAAFSEAGQLVAELTGVSMDKIPAEGIQWPVSADGKGTERLELTEESKGKVKFSAVRL